MLVTSLPSVGNHAGSTWVDQVVSPECVVQRKGEVLAVAA